METNPDSQSEKTKLSTTDKLILIARMNFKVVKTTESDFLAIPLSGPRVAKSIAGMQNSLGDDLMKRYYDEYRIAPSERAVKDSIRVLVSEANASEQIRAYIRYATIDGAIYVDLGDSTGQAVKITAGHWEIIDVPPVCFRRTALIGALPRPEEGGDIDKLFSIINIPDQLRALVIGFLVAGMNEDIPHPIMGINGEQGSGKSDAAKRLAALIDPSPATLQSPPKDVPAWIDLAQGAYVISLDNLSRFSDALSDAFCRASTGNSLVKRQLYSDRDLVVYEFKRVLILNGINLTEMRDDLADRLIPINLPVIYPEGRRYASDLDNEWDREYSKILGALYDLLAKVLEVLPSIELKELPRMADFAKILAALDKIRGTDSLADYQSEMSSAATNSVDNDLFLKAITKCITSTWTGTASDLLDYLNSCLAFTFEKTKTWPQNARQATDRIMRSAPTLRKIGWVIDDLGSGNHLKKKMWAITPPAGRAGDLFTSET